MKAWVSRSLTFALFGAVLALAATLPARAQTPADADAVATRITALKTKVGSTVWDLEVEMILVAAYDRDKTEVIDTAEELAAVDCQVWLALDRSIRGRGGKGGGLIARYGFRAKGDYFGDALGISEKLRQATRARLAACGLKDN